jgi:hypothetical protein
VLGSESPSDLASDSDSASGPDSAPGLVAVPGSVVAPDSETASDSALATAFGPASAPLAWLSALAQPVASVQSPGRSLQFPLPPEFVVFVHARSRRW